MRDDLRALAMECQTEGEFPASSGAWKGAQRGFAKKLRAILSKHQLPAQPIVEQASIAELLKRLEMDEQRDQMTVLGPDYYREHKDVLNALPDPASIRAAVWEEWADESVELQLDANEQGIAKGRADAEQRWVDLTAALETKLGGHFIIKAPDDKDEVNPWLLNALDTVLLALEKAREGWCDNCLLGGYAPSRDIPCTKCNPVGRSMTSNELKKALGHDEP